MEAFALGRPVIATSLSGIPELVRPGVNGWLVPAGSVEALVSAMREVLQAEPAHLGAMGRAGAAAASERHDARREARTLFALFQRSSGACAGRAPADRDSASEGPAPVPRAAAR
jgi:glycosyltransferase involved in cell wall biosynthesis